MNVVFEGKPSIIKFFFVCFYCICLRLVTCEVAMTKEITMNPIHILSFRFNILVIFVESFYGYYKGHNFLVLT